MPSQSIARSASGSRLTAPWVLASQTVKITRGTLTQKIARQETASTSAPPPAGPITVAIPVQAVQVPTALPRSAPSKVAAMIAREPGTSSAPVSPCSARAPIRKALEGASAQRIEVTPKPTSPSSNIRRRPNWSPSAPPTRISETVASAYASTTHCWSARPAFRSSEIAGSATLTTVASRKTIVEPRIVAIIVKRWLRRSSDKAPPSLRGRLHRPLGLLTPLLALLGAGRPMLLFLLLLALLRRRSRAGSLASGVGGTEVLRLVAEAVVIGVALERCGD